MNAPTTLNKTEILFVSPELLWNNNFRDQQHVTKYLKEFLCIAFLKILEMTLTSM